MNEKEINTLMGVTTDPINNVYRIDNLKDLNEIQRIIRIFQISESQEIKHRLFSIKNVATFKLVLSNN